MTPGRRAVIVTGSAMLCGLLVGCAGSPAARYHRIATVPGVPDHAARLNIALRPIIIPSYLDRNGVPEPSRPAAFAVFDNDLWAAPLAGMLQSALVLDLAQRLPESIVIGGGGAIALRKSAAIAINVLRFDPDPAGHIQFEADVSVQADAGQPRRTTYVHLASAQGGLTPDQIVDAMAAVWAAFADRIATLLVTS